MVSIIIPCYNQGKYLSAALNSVYQQTYQDWECIIVNDGSPDNTEEVAKHWLSRDSRFKYVLKENGGLSSARNAGLLASKGKYIQLLDADDLLEKYKLDKFISIYQNERHDSNTIFYSSMRYFEEKNPNKYNILGRDNLIAHIELKKTDSFESQVEALSNKNICVISAPIYPKKLFESIGMFDEELLAFEDWDFHLRCTKHKYIFHHEYFEHANTLIRLHDQSMMRKSNHMKMNFEKFSIKNGLNVEKQTNSNKKFNYLLRDFIPPIFIKLIKKI